jgi:hypothetical protein
MVCLISLSPGAKPQYPLHRKVGGPHDLSGNGRKEKYLCSCWELNSDSMIVILYPSFALIKFKKWRCVTRFKMLFSLQPWSFYWSFNIFYTSSDWSSLFILKHSHHGSSEMYARVWVLQCPSLLKRILLSSISLSPQGRKPQEKWGETLDRLPGARTMLLPSAVWGIEHQIPRISWE